jgi:hypothetical protein
VLPQDGQTISALGSFDKAFDLLRETVILRRAQVQDLLSTRLVQTNEVRRSIYLFASIVRICVAFPDRQIALFEIGASAGLNLLFDKYQYQFNNERRFGDLNSRVKIRAELRGDGRPRTTMPENDIVSRTGVDLNPIDVNDPNEVDWLKALVWPEHEERRQLLDAALSLRREENIEMVVGDGVEVLSTYVDGIPKGVVPIVFHTHVANQLSFESKESLQQEVDRQGRLRDIVHLHNNIQPNLHATIYKNSARSELRLSNTDGHARWVEWLDS